MQQKLCSVWLKFVHTFLLKKTRYYSRYETKLSLLEAWCKILLTLIWVDFLGVVWQLAKGGEVNLPSLAKTREDYARDLRFST